MTAPATADDVVLDRLRPHIDEITTPSDRSVGFHPKTWRPLASQLGTDHADGHVRLFTATMIWGSGTRNGRGPRNTCRALRAPSLAATLQRSAALVTHEDFASAYVAARLPGVGPAFFTKWLWAVGLARPRPAGTAGTPPGPAGGLIATSPTSAPCIAGPPSSTRRFPPTGWSTSCTSADGTRSSDDTPEPDLQHRRPDSAAARVQRAWCIEPEGMGGAEQSGGSPS